MDWGEKDIEGIPLLNAGRVVKFTPMTDESITLKVYPVIANGGSAASATEAVVNLFHNASYTATQPMVVPNLYSRQKFGIIILWSETIPTTSQTVPAASLQCSRIQIVNAYMTKYKPAFDDKTFTAELTFKWTPFQKDGTKNKIEESTDGSTQLAAAITTSTTLP